MSLFMAGKRAEEVQAELLCGGYPADTPCAVAHRVSWPDEVLVRCRLDGLAKAVEGGQLQRHSVLLVGPALLKDSPG
jgi:precorrin-4 methylase